MRRNKPGNLAFRTTIIEDTHLTLAAILFNVEANYSIVFFAITNIREKNCRVSIPGNIYNSLSNPMFHMELCHNVISRSATTPHNHYVILQEGLLYIIIS